MRFTYTQIQDAIDEASKWFEPLEAETYVVQEFINRLQTSLNKVKEETN